MEAIKTVVAGRTFFIDPCPECGQAEVRIREEDGTAYGVCPCCDGVSAFPDEHVREQGFCPDCGTRLEPHPIGGHLACPMAGL